MPSDPPLVLPTVTVNGVAMSFDWGFQQQYIQQIAYWEDRRDGAPGGGSGGGPPGTNCHEWDSDDMFAADLRQVLENLGNFEETEHGSVMVLENGVYSSTGIFQGAQNGLTGQWHTNLVGPDSSANVIGIIHNHPIRFGDLPTNRENRYPSTGDWQAAQDFVADGANANNFALYIIDPFGIMRKFPYTDRNLYEGLSTFQKRSGEGLPPRMLIGGPAAGC